MNEVIINQIQYVRYDRWSFLGKKLTIVRFLKGIIFYSKEEFDSSIIEHCISQVRLTEKNRILSIRYRF